MLSFGTRELILSAQKQPYWTTNASSGHFPCKRMKPVICTNAAPTFRLSVKVRRSEQKRRRHDPAGSADSSSRHSGTGQDSGFGSDSARIRIVQIEQQSGASHHCIARPSHKSTITKNLSFIPFDIFLTASKLSLMTYSCSSSPKGSQPSSGAPSTPEKETCDKVKAYEKQAHLHLHRVRIDRLSAKHKQSFEVASSRASTL